MLHHYILGHIRASNEWTTVAHWLDLPNYFSPTRKRQGKEALVEGLAQEILAVKPLRTYLDVATASWVIKDIATFIPEQQQRELLKYLRNIPIELE